MAVEAWHTAFPRPRANRSMGDSPLVEERQGFPPRIKQILTRAAQACLIKPNARKAYPLALSRVRPATIRGPHLRIGHRRLIHTHKRRGGRGQMSAIEAIVITALGTAAAVVWALCLEASGRKSRPRR